MKLLPTLTAALALALPTSLFASDEVPGQMQNVALVGGTVHTVSGETIEGGAVVITDGKISAVGPVASMSLPDDLEQIDVAGHHVYPGLFDPSSQVGLVEINSVDMTVDFNEQGSINPNAQAHVAVNPDSELIPTIRANGVLLAHVHPIGGFVSGQGAIMAMDGWTYEDMTMAAPTGIVVNWPNMLPRQAWWIETSVAEQIRERDEQLQEVEELFDRAESYKAAREAAGLETGPSSRPADSDADAPAGAPPFDAKLEAMAPLFDGELPLLIAADEASQISAAVAFGERRGIKVVIVGGGEAHRVADLLVAADVPVIIDGTQRMPRGRDAAVDEAFALPGKLAEAGVVFAISDDRRPAFSRNLPYHAATAVPFGLSREDAIKSITLWPAEIFGVSDRVGSLEAGKDATLFVADGDILEVPTHVTHAWIAGRRVDLSSRHTRLNDKYKQRYGQE